MNIIATQYTLKTKAYEIYVAGCSGPHCEDCYSPETWSFTVGEEYNEEYKDKIRRKIKEFKDIIQNVMIFGGEPLDQDMEQLTDLIKLVKNKYNLPVWIFTHYSIDEAIHRLGETFELVDYIKTGPYIPELKVENNEQFGINLATSNQKIYKLVHMAYRTELITETDNEKHKNLIKQKLAENKKNFGEAYCPCSIQKNKSTICSCKEFREMDNEDGENVCHCRLYNKKIIWRKGEPRLWTVVCNVDTESQQNTMMTNGGSDMDAQNNQMEKQ